MWAHTEALHYVGFSGSLSEPTVISVLEEPDTASFAEPVYIALWRSKVVLKHFTFMHRKPAAADAFFVRRAGKMNSPYRWRN